jgi:ribosomal protein L24E
VAERAQVRPITNEEGNRLLRILRRGTGSVVTWRRAQMVLLRTCHETCASPNQKQKRNPSIALWAKGISETSSVVDTSHYGHCGRAADPEAG